MELTTEKAISTSNAPDDIDLEKLELVAIYRASIVARSVGGSREAIVIAFFRQQSSSFRNLYCKDTWFFSTNFERGYLLIQF